MECYIEGMERKRKNANFINGVPELLVLKLLSGDKLYGYQLVKEIQKLNPQAFDFGEGCIYPILHSLEKDGLLHSEEVPVNGRMRLYYSTTAAGKARLEDLSREWMSTIEGVSRLFGDAMGVFGGTVAGLAGFFAQADNSAGQVRPAPEDADEADAEETHGQRSRAQAGGN